MATDLAFVVPYAGSCEYRERNLRAVLDALSRFFPGAQVAVGRLDPDEPWVKAKAVANGLAQLRGNPMVVVHDADSWSPTLYRAVSAVRSGAADWAMPHVWVNRLTPEATENFLADPSSVHNAALERDRYEGLIGGGIVVLRPGLYQRVPLDPHFTRWGREDRAWGFALLALAGRFQRVENGHLWHLWHPPAERDEAHPEGGSPENDERFARYVRAKADGTLGSIVAEYA